MAQISAAENHTIDTSNGYWRLVYNDRPLAEGTTKGFRYSNRFGVTRRLPQTGVLGQDDIQQVVLGWQQTDECWHLGLILSPELADSRGSRWCELVYWPDPDITVFQDLAQDAGQRLAQAVRVPFYVIPPQPVEPPSPPRPLPELPLQIGDWEMVSRGNTGQEAEGFRQYVLQRMGVWTMRKLMRVGWYILWAFIYLALSVATLVSDIALPNTGTLLPNPQILPYMGIVISILLFAYALYELFITTTSANRIFVDGVRGTVSAWRGKRMHWMVPRAEIQSVYVSEVVKKREQPPATEYGELNLHLGGGDFQFIMKQEQPAENNNIPQPELMIPRTEDIREITRDTVHTALQAAAVYVAEALGDKPVWFDQRVK